MSGYSNSEASLKSLAHYMDKCGICGQPEGDDPKAHVCEFNCGACGQYFDEEQADDNNHHLADFCDAYDEEEI